MIHLFGEDQLRAVTYYRHSAEDKQENSVPIQREKTEEFAGGVKVEILEQFADEGVSGITADRPAFQTMFRKYVLDPNAPKIDYILVYDASRFGRFQSRPEAWRLLSMMDEKGIQLATVNRGLPKKDANVMDDIMLILDLAQAGEGSKLLSDKVFYGCFKVSTQGYSAGGSAPYGYTRILLSEQRERISVLNRGEKKMISNQRVSFEPSTTGEADVVKRIFTEFVRKGKYPDEIAKQLNRDSVVTAMGKTWRPEYVVKILLNETYAGTRIYNRTWSRLKKKAKRNPESEWARCANAHEGLVTPEVFRMAKERLRYIRPRADRLSIRKYWSAESYVWKFIEEQIESYTDDQKFFIRQNFPAIFGTLYKSGDKTRSCFYLPKQIKKSGEVLAFSIDPEMEKPSLYEISIYESESLGTQGFLLVDQGNKLSLDKEDTITAIKNICDKLIEQHCPWLKTESFTAG